MEIIRGRSRNPDDDMSLPLQQSLHMRRLYDRDLGELIQSLGGFEPLAVEG